MIFRFDIDCKSVVYLGYSQIVGERRLRYIYQLCFIMFFVLLGELMEHYILLPIAGSVYGMVLLFLALVFGIVKLSWVEDVANWLHSVMSLFFIAPAVAIIDIWAEISDVWWILAILMLVAYLVTMITTGVTAESLIGRKQKRSGGKK